MEAETSSSPNLYAEYWNLIDSLAARGLNGQLLAALLVGAGLIFKGSGFYTTDYRSDSYKKAAKADQETTSDQKGGKKAGEE